MVIDNMGTPRDDGSTMSTAAISRQPICVEDKKVLISGKGIGGSSFEKLPDEIIEQ
jgi:hypothetical protein